MVEIQSDFNLVLTNKVCDMEKLDRLKKAVAYLKGQQIIKTQREVADAMGFHKSTISLILNRGGKYLTESFLIKFCDAFREISRDWLIHEKGEMANQSIGDISHSTAVGNNVNGSGNVITNNDISKMIELQKGYQKVIQKNQEQLDKSQEQIDRLIGIIEKINH
ncbi:MAG: helix-turn-helix domain-containing protein [Bacteroidales bacterium]|jgi:transcriptional regulator with XRE-family HTH domain|nr:helix-turn-helix domain-containing protein [Bacteroidales bacterium]